MKVFAHGVIGVVVKAFVFPVCIDICRHGSALASQPSQGFYMPVAYLQLGQRLTERFGVVLRIGARPRNSADIDDQVDLELFQNSNEFNKRMR